MMRSQPAVLQLLGHELLMWTVNLRDLFHQELRFAGRPTAELDAYLLYCLVEGTIQQYLLEPKTYPLEAVVAQIIGQYAPN